MTTPSPDSETGPAAETAGPVSDFLRLLVLQQEGWGSPASEDVEANARHLIDWTDRELTLEPADIAVLPELSTTPYFCCRRDDRYFNWAEPIPGFTTDGFADVARRHRATIVVPMFERGPEGETYNAAAVVGPDGELIEGEVGERRISSYRKCHVPTIENPPDTEAWEDHFFRPGSGFPVFRTRKATIGILICYDRWFPEAWRMLATEGAQLVLVPMVAWGFVQGPYLPMLQSRAVENGLFAASCNRAGLEELDGISMDHFGRSAVIAPTGEILTIAEPGEAKRAIRAELDLGAIERQREILPLLEHRRVDLYGEPGTWTRD